MTATYLSLTNDAIQESGADLASFETDGSDWTTTTDSLRLKFKKWVARAWKEIQQDSFDLSFMEEQAVVTVDPGFHFFTDGTAVPEFNPLENTNVDIYDQDATIAINAIPFGTIYDLTGVSTNTKPYGYVDVVTTSSTPIQWALKPGAEYFSFSTQTAFDSHYFLSNFVASPFTNNITSSGFALPLVVNMTIGVATWEVGLIQFAPSTTSADSEMYIAVHTADSAAIDTALTGPYTVAFHNPSDNRLLGSMTVASNSKDTDMAPTTITTVSKAYVHSWKSFDFSEETGINDFQENIKQIDQKSFKIINYFQAPPTGEVPMDFVSWEVFSPLYDLSSTPPGIPRIITRDNTNRFRLYPHPYQKMTLKFDYIRTPQILSAYDEVPKGIDDDITDMIMWRALIMYGEYDEQPSVIARANKNWNNFRLRFDQKYRPTFHFRPARLW